MGPGRPARGTLVSTVPTPAISVGSSSTRNLDLCNDLNNRLHEDARTRIERRRERHRREDRDDDIAEGCLALSPEFRQATWPKKFKIDVLRYDGTTNPETSCTSTRSLRWSLGPTRS